MARTSSKFVKSIPSSESGHGMLCHTKPNKSGDKYIISHNPSKMKFTLWKCIKDEENGEECFEKIATSDSPLDLNEMIPYERK